MQACSEFMADFCLCASRYSMRCHGHQNLIPNISVYASLINIHPLLQKVVCRQFNSMDSKGNYNLDTNLNLQ